MLGEEKMSVRKRLSKSSKHAEEKEEGQRDCTEECQETPSNGEAFLFLRWINEIGNKFSVLEQGLPSL